MRNLASMLALLLALPFNASALGLGDVELLSALNEPLEARIALNAVKAGDLDSLQVGLATSEQFQRAGIDRPFILSKIRFNVVADNAGGAAIHLTTREPVSEPFLNFLLELNWSSGRVIREYTMLLDPPVYGAAIQAVVEEAISTVDELPELGEAEPDVVVPPSPTSVPSGGGSALISPGSYGPVKTSDTLWSIVQTYRRDQSVTIHQAMLSILRANPDGFAEDNVNTLRAGVVLRIPDRDEMNAMSAEAALAEVKRQHARWEEYRQTVAASVSAAAQGSVAGSTSTSTTSTAASGEQVEADSESTESPEEEEARLELVSAGSAVEGVGSDSVDIAALRDQLTAAMEQIDSGNRENVDLTDKLGEAEKIISDLQRFIELKDDNIAALQEQLAEAQAELDAVQQELDAKAALSVEAETPKTTATEQEQAAQPKEAASSGTTTVPVPTVEPPKSFMESVREMLPVDPLMLAAGGVGVLVLVLLGFVMARRGRGRVDSEAPVVRGRREPLVAGAGSEAATEFPDYEEEDATERPLMAEATDMDAGEDEEEGDEEATVIREAFDTSAAPAGVPRVEEEDPLEGLNIYLAYEDYENATKLVRSVIQTHPDRQEYKLRLLEIFYAAKNPAAFEAAARELQRAIGDDHTLMDKARHWWADLSPDRELFAEGGFDTSVADTAGDDIFDVTGEVDHSDTMEISLDEVEADGGGGGVDFDLGFEFDGGGLGGETAAMQEGAQTIDFDLGGEAGISASAAGDTDLDIDFERAEGVSTEAGVGEAARRDPDDTGLDFDLDMELPSGVQTEAATSEEELGIDSDVMVPGEGTAVPEVSSADEGLDLDVDLELAPEAEAASLVSAGADLDFDLDMNLPVEERGGEFALEADLDLGLDLEEEAVKPSSIFDDEVLDFDLDMEVPSAAPSGRAEDLEVSRRVAPEPEVAQAESGHDFTLDLSQLAGDAVPIGGNEDTGDFSLDLDAPAPRPEADASSGGGDEIDFLFNLDDTADVTHLSTDSIALVDTASEDEDADGFSDLLIDAHETGDEDSDDDTETTQFMLRDVEPAGMDLDAGDGILDLTFGEESDSADLDLTLDVEDVDESAAHGFEQTAVNLTIGEASTEPTPDFETVQLKPADLARVGVITPDENTDTLDEASVQVDGDFEGLFGDEGGGLADDLPELDLEFPDSALAAEEADVPNALDIGLGFDEWSDSSAREQDADEDDPGQFEKTQFMLRDIAAITADPERPRRDDDDEEDRTLALGRSADGGTDEMQTKLDLAQAYIDMGDVEGARGILGEVMAEGNDAQQSIARDLLGKLT